MLCFQVPERENGYPVIRYTLEMQELGLSNAEHMNVTGKKLGKKKVCNNQDVVVQSTTTRVWVVVYDGKELLYVFHHLAYSTKCDSSFKLGEINNEADDCTVHG